MRYLVALCLACITCCAAAQKLDESYVIAWLKLTDSIPKGQTRSYLIHGYPALNSSNIDSILSTKKVKDLLSIKAIYPLVHHHDSAEMDSDDHHNAIVHIDFKSEQTRKEKRHYWKMAKGKFVDLYTQQDQLEKDKEPLLFIDDEVILGSQSKTRIEQLRFKDIYALTVYDRQFKVEAWGEQAKNGMVQIWTHATKE